MNRSIIFARRKTAITIVRYISKGQIEAERDLSKIYDHVRAQRFEDIVVIQTKNVSPRYLVLASAFNHRHLLSGTEKVNTDFKNNIRRPEQDFAQISISAEWNVLDFDTVVVHLFMKACRQHFDIEHLWAVGGEYDSA